MRKSLAYVRPLVLFVLLVLTYPALDVRANPQPQAPASGGARLSLGAQLSGLWRTIDERSHKATSLVRLIWNGEQLTGKLEKILKADVPPTARCVKCKGERKDAPLVGLGLLWGLHEEGDALVGGEVLDPSTGKIYRAKMTLRDANHVELRGYLGIPALGRTQVWERVAQSEESK